jgi:hypothetical protein
MILVGDNLSMPRTSLISERRVSVYEIHPMLVNKKYTLFSIIVIDSLTSLCLVL